MPGNGYLIGVERIFHLYLSGCAIQTFETDALSHIKAQCNIEAESEALDCYFNNFK